MHISELADFRVNKTEDIVLGDEIIVKCIGMTIKDASSSVVVQLEENKSDGDEEKTEESPAEEIQVKRAEPANA